MTVPTQVDFKKEVVDLIEKLSDYGRTPDDGVTRVLFSDIWMDTQKFLERDLKERGFSARFDKVGNLYGRIEGKESKETIMVGSHIDTVVNGGKLDGQYGIVAGILAMEELAKRCGQPKKNMEVVSMAEEEGSRFPYTFWGSKNIVGSVPKEEVANLEDANGISFIDAMKEKGFDFKEDKGDTREDIKAYFELHIEQGGVLEIEEKSVGIVTSIVGQKRFTIEVQGEANHAGTTPMGYRKDPLHGASKMISAILETAIEYGDPLVATVGKLDVTPNTSNVVPGKVVFSLDTRHTDNEVVTSFIEKVRSIIEEVGTEMNLMTNINQYMDGIPVPMDEELVNQLEEICKEKGMAYKVMHSGAGHDAQIFAPVVPTSLIFVPSKNGISHNPLEYTDPSDLGVGVELLMEMLYKLAY